MKGERELDVGKFQSSEVTNVMKTSAEIQTRLKKRIGNHTFIAIFDEILKTWEEIKVENLLNRPS
jgi:hypothetical protein